jgi:hypothetical protein
MHSMASQSQRRRRGTLGRGSSTHGVTTTDGVTDTGGTGTLTHGVTDDGVTTMVTMTDETGEWTTTMEGMTTVEMTTDSGDTSTDGTTGGEDLCECKGAGWGDQCDACKIQWFYVFASSVAYPGNLGGLAGADEKCQKLATDAGRPGTFMAWIANDDENSGPVHRFPAMGFGTRPFKLVAKNDALVQSSWNDMLSKGELLRPIDTDELGEQIKTHLWVWSNVSAGGYALGKNSCDSWSWKWSIESLIDPMGAVGRIPRSPGCKAEEMWSHCYDSRLCASEARLYCFQVPPAGG